MSQQAFRQQFELAAGAFSTVGMGEAGACAVVVGGGRCAGLGAGGGPPARSVAWQFTHFRAAQFRFGLSAFAVAAAGGDGAG